MNIFDMKTVKTLLAGTAALTIGVATSQAQNIFTNTAGSLVNGATNVAKSAAGTAYSGAKGVAGKAYSTAKGAAGTAYSGARGLASMPGKAMNMGDNFLPNLSAGTQEFGLDGNVQFGGDVIYNLNLSYGYFFKDNWEVGFTAGIQGADTQLGADIGLFTEYNFNLGSKFVPYVGASVALASLSTDNGGSLNSSLPDDATSVALGGEVGVKYFLRENIAITGSVDFKWSPDDVFGGVEDASAAASNINIGTRFYF